MPKVIQIVTAFVLALPTTVMSSPIAGSHFRVGAWQGDANVDDRSRRFSYCTIGKANRSGYGLVISLNAASEVQISLYSMNSEFEGESEIDFGVIIDENPFIRVKGYKLNNGKNNFATIPIYDRSFLNQLAAGNQLRIRSYIGDISFSLSGSRKAIGGLFECVKTYS